MTFTVVLTGKSNSLNSTVPYNINLEGYVVSVLHWTGPTPAIFTSNFVGGSVLNNTTCNYIGVSGAPSLHVCANVGWIDSIQINVLNVDLKPMEDIETAAVLVLQFRKS